MKKEKSMRQIGVKGLHGLAEKLRVECNGSCAVAFLAPHAKRKALHFAKTRYARVFRGTVVRSRCDWLLKKRSVVWVVVLVPQKRG